jgi:hypothetical protein
MKLIKYVKLWRTRSVNRGVSLIRIMKCRLIEWVGYTEHGRDEKCMQNLSQHEGKRSSVKIILKRFKRSGGGCDDVDWNICCCVHSNELWSSV